MEPRRPLSFDEYVLPGIPYRSTAGDITTFVLFGAVGALLIVVGWGGEADPSLPLGSPAALWIILVICVAALLLKRRAPLVTVAVIGATAIAATLLVIGGPPMLAIIALIDALYAATLYLRGRRRTMLFALAGAFAVGQAGALALGPAAELGGRDLISLLSVAMLIALPVAWGTAVSQRDQLLQVERERAEAVAAAAEAQREAAVRAERGEIAAHLHDEIAARLSAISLQAGALQTVPDENPRRARAVAAMRESSHEALGELRRLIGVLAEDRRDDDADVDDSDPVAAVEEQARAFGVEARIQGESGDLPASVAHALARIAREAVANAARHAPGAAIDARFVAGGDAVTMTIENPLPPAPAGAEGTGLGRALMTERWRALGGSGSAGPAGDVWRVTTTIPLLPQDSDEGITAGSAT